MVDNVRVGGIKVEEIQQDSLLNDLGIQEGDIIRRVNGREISGLGSMQNIYRELKNKKVAVVKLKRNGQDYLFTYRLYRNE